MNFRLLIISKIQAFEKEHGRPPKKKEFEAEFGSKETKTAIEIFGSWRKAIEAAGFCTNYAVSDEEIKKVFDQMTAELGRFPKSQEFQPYYQVLHRKYGSWERSLEALGVTIMTKESAEKELRDFFEKHHRAPSQEEVSNAKDIAKLLGHGNWAQALRSVGINPPYAYNLTKDDLIQLILQKKEELGRTPTAPDLPQYSTIIRRFGSWNAAIQAAGLEPWKKEHNSYLRITDKQLLSDIQILILSKNGERPLYREYQHRGLCVKRFGKWSHAVDLALQDPYHTMQTAKMIWDQK